jgi:hypothetical protein
MQIEREVNTCEAELSHLTTYAMQHSVDVLQYYVVLVDIRDNLDRIKVLIDQRRSTTNTSDEPWWRSATRWIARAADFVANLFGIRTGLSKLLPPRSQHYLPPGDNED